MKKNYYFQVLAALVVCLTCALGAAAAEAYACYTSWNTTLTFYFDNDRNLHSGTTYDLNGNNAPGWRSDGTNANVTKVVFNSSFAGARPTSTYQWFSSMTNLTSITGLSYLNTEDVTTMQSMFFNCNKLTSLDVSGFNTASVTDMLGIFNNCSGLTSLDVTRFNTAQVVNMGNMFAGCTGLTNLDLSNFNTAKVTNMKYMFYGCTNLTTIYVGSGWTTNAVTQSSEMFYNCTKLVGGQGTTYNSSHIDKAYAHIDGGTSNPGYLTAPPEAYACYTPSNTTLTFYYDSRRSSRTGTTYDLNEGNDWPGWRTDGNNASVTRVVFDSSFAGARPTSTYLWFGDMVNLTSITGMKQYLNTSSVTNMSAMFYWCKAMTSFDLSGFNTAQVKYMDDLFMGCSNLSSLDLSSFNTAQVVDMYNMFYGCSSLTSLDVSNFDTSKVIGGMDGMFAGCSGLTNLDLSNFNTAQVKYMSYMFRGCSGLTSLDLSGFNTAQVIHMKYMFQGCSGLTTIYAGSGWSTAPYSEDMFLDCTRLMGGQGTTYDANHVDGEYAHIDGGTSNPGYFSEKYMRGDVNGDSAVNITDVTALIDLLLSGAVPPAAADVNADGNVNITDVTALIDYLLSGSWN